MNIKNIKNRLFSKIKICKEANKYQIFIQLYHLIEVYMERLTNSQFQC